MVGAEAAADAVDRARRLPSLKVGLHIVLVEGRPVSSPKTIPDLVDSDGEFPCHLVRAGFRFFFRRGIRRQLEREIRAQFEAFRKTRLVLDHVNAHNHMHLHPTVLALILRIGSEFGLKAVRLPYEPLVHSWRASGGMPAARLAATVFLWPWTSFMRTRLRSARLLSNDFLLGLHDSGSMTPNRVLRMLRVLPNGITEMVFHPATRRCAELDKSMSHYQHLEEYRALIHPQVRETLVSLGVQTIAFNDL
jgi:hopanoid biosynthesis associated protein HpnK